MNKLATEYIINFKIMEVGGGALGGGETLQGNGLFLLALITYYISNNTFNPIDKSAIISIIAHFL